MIKLDFILRSNRIHNNKYNYSETIYINNKTKVKIYCNYCNNYFYQIPYHHLKGHGCQVCSKNKKLSTEEFINKATLKYGDDYNYSLVEYKNAQTKVKIICKYHGIIEQRPFSHLKSRPRCCSKYIKMCNKEFIEKVKLIHGIKYDYSLVSYKNSRTKIKIICNIHNYIFEQTPNNHLSKKHNCPLCGNMSRRLKRIEEISINKFNGNQIVPSFNKDACDIFDIINKEKGINIKHATNGGEYYIQSLGYWLDGYDKDNNTVYEYDEKHHFDKVGNLIDSDIIRQQEIINHLNCKFIRIRYDENIKDILYK
jgi:hypothetical protein